MREETIASIGAWEEKLEIMTTDRQTDRQGGRFTSNKRSVGMYFW